MCTRPLRYWQSDKINPLTGKYFGFVSGYDFPFAVANDFIKRGFDCSPSYETKDFIEVPCGHCPECLSKKKLNWVARCLAEKETSAFSYFITLTYDDSHLIMIPHLQEIQRFVNRLRKYMKLRYLVVGELGDKSNRAHYHMILFTEKELDLVLLKKGDLPLYRCELLEKCWDYKGFVSVGHCNGATIAYTVGYIVSKDKKTVFKSQSQGLGSKFFSKLEDRYAIGTGQGKEIVVSLPRYLKEKYGLKYLYDKDTQSLIWNNRVVASGLSEEDYRDFSEYLSSAKLTKKVI